MVCSALSYMIILVVFVKFCPALSKILTWNFCKILWDGFIHLFGILHLCEQLLKSCKGHYSDW